MPASTVQRYVTPEQYLKYEQARDFKSEYVDGVIVNISNVSIEHCVIGTNLLVAVAHRLREAGTGYRAYGKGLFVRIPALNRYYFPDLSVVLGRGEFEPAHDVEALLNPSLIVEILCDISEERDRGEKWLAYKEIETLNTYVLIHQDRPLAEVFDRESDSNTWRITEVAGLEAIISLPAIGIEVPMGELYYDIEFGQRREMESRN
jgi:Uma2 family endonuclease